ncbi:MAG: hypothetical protein U1G05_19135 [Kiritimatiellia bacterium]
MFDTRTPRKRVVRPHNTLVKVHTVDDLLKRPEAESKDLPEELPNPGRESIQNYLPPDPNIPAMNPNLPSDRNTPRLTRTEQEKAEKEKNWITAENITRDPRKPEDPEKAAGRPDLDQLSDRMLFKDSLSLDDQGDVLKAPERGQDERDKRIAEKDKRQEDGAAFPSAWSRGADSLAEDSARGDVPGFRRENVERDGRGDEAYGAASLMMNSAAGRNALRDQDEKERAESSFTRSRELMAEISAPYLDKERERRTAGAAEGNALQQLASAYRLEAGRPSPSGLAEPAAGTEARNPLAGLSTPEFSRPSASFAQTPASFTPVNPEVRLSPAATPFASAPERPGMFTPTDVSITLPKSSPALPADALSSPARTPEAALPDPMRQRRRDDSRVKSQMNVLPGMTTPGRFGR